MIILGEFSELHTQKVENLIVLYLTRKWSKLFEILIKFVFYPFKQCVQISINLNKF